MLAAPWPEACGAGQGTAGAPVMSCHGRSAVRQNLEHIPVHTLLPLLPFYPRPPATATQLQLPTPAPWENPSVSYWPENDNCPLGRCLEHPGCLGPLTLLHLDVPAVPPICQRRQISFSLPHFSVSLGMLIILGLSTNHPFPSHPTTELLPASDYASFPSLHTPLSLPPLNPLTPIRTLTSTGYGKLLRLLITVRFIISTSTQWTHWMLTKFPAFFFTPPLPICLY